MLVELVRTTTADGHRLDGALWAASEGALRRVDADAFLLLHGVGGNFYSGGLFDYLSKKLVDAGIVVLRVNTRGHDTVSVSWGATGPVRQGAAYEVVEQCQQDVTAWLDFLERRNWHRVGILGHSLGGIKAIYSQSFAAHRAVKYVVACSAPRLSYSAFMNSDSQPRFFESLSTARDFVDKGQPDSLITAKFPFPILITAAGYLEKYGPEERYNIVRFVDRLTCPTLVTYGSLELDNGGPAFAGMPEALAGVRRPDQSLAVETIPGGDHIYTGVHDGLGERLISWLQGRAAGTAG